MLHRPQLQSPTTAALARRQRSLHTVRPALPVQPAESCPPPADDSEPQTDGASERTSEFSAHFLRLLRCPIVGCTKPFLIVSGALGHF